jgi:hypothetical protein
VRAISTSSVFQLKISNLQPPSFFKQPPTFNDDSISPANSQISNYLLVHKFDAFSKSLMLESLKEKRD